MSANLRSWALASPAIITAALNSAPAISFFMTISRSAPAAIGFSRPVSQAQAEISHAADWLVAATGVLLRPRYCSGGSSGLQDCCFESRPRGRIIGGNNQSLGPIAGGCLENAVCMAYRARRPPRDACGGRAGFSARKAGGGRIFLG